ncbi:hypothetical protein GCM10010218_22850 [Streptomyces mashuensis]|uniref:DUF1023 domain-containing protein n=1 Tax=Streptomyces mashuensis TaxID=33904 RepID=A0A919ED13_9ACTN|nr:alpha/beta hydrolase [Streptomyces mashuensis]GHF40866.1 hypothetical protein GCM10010218_22850 [Streptomyces mashuensis]
MVSIEDLKNLDTTKFTTAADSWSAASNRAGEAKRRVDSVLGTLAATQKGKAATSVLSRLARLSRNYQYIHAECGMIRTALSGLAEELAGPQQKLKHALEDAEALKFTVRKDGSVDYPRDPSTPAPLLPTPAVPGKPSLLKPSGNQDKAQGIADRIGTALQEAAEIDGRYAKVLAKLKADPSLDKTDWLDVAQDMKDLRAAAGKHFSEAGIPKGKSAKENAEWWERRSQAEKDEYLALYPERIGALDGLPSSVRDAANRVVLAEGHAETKQQLDDWIERKPDEEYERRTRGEWRVRPEWNSWREERDRIKEKLEGIKAIEARLAQPTGTDGLPEAYLLGFDTKGNGHAIVANGNPDTATNTAVYVPGTYSKLAGAEGDVKRMTDLWRAVHALPGSPEASTITWIGYDAPQSIVPQAMNKSYAHAGAPKLNDFLDGLQTVQGGADKSHTTIIGHSYGSTTVGDASLKGKLAADDIIVAGSPGVLVNDAGKLDVGKDHVWSEAASDDDVPLGGKIAGLGEPKRIGPDEDGRISYKHVVPSDKEFGGHRMKVDTSGHSKYWTPDSLSLQNQAVVVAGMYDRVVEE